MIHETLHIDVAALMGANLADEVAADSFCEATIGCTDVKGYASVFKNLFQTDSFRINVLQDANTVELCGALKVSQLDNNLIVRFCLF